MTASRAPGSLRWRMLAGTLAWIAAIIVLAGWGLGSLFRQHISEQLRAELALHMNQLTAAVSVAPDGRPTVASPLSDPRLEQPLSGLYWQIDRLDDAGRVVAAGVARSRSLWDQVLALPATDRADGFHDIAGPENHDLSALTRLLKPEDSDAGALRLVVAADRAVLAEPIERFDHMLLLSLGALAAGLVAAAVVQVMVGLRPLGRLRRQLAAQQGRNSVRIEGRFPSEIQPLVDDFNRVLAVNADIVQRARTQAGNLAHAVKTPLTILGNAAMREEGAFARLVREQVAMAQRQIDHHLARARAPRRPPARRADARRCGRRYRRCCASCSACMRHGNCNWRWTNSPTGSSFAARSRTCRKWSATCSTTPANGPRGASASAPRRPRQTA